MTAWTDSEGNFEVKGDRRLHMKPGKYGVRVSQWVDKKTRQRIEPEEVEQQKLAGLAVNALPFRYSDPESNPPISVDIKSGSNTGLKIEVKGQ